MSSYKHFEDLQQEEENVQAIRTNNGTNFVGANSELNKAYSEVNHKKINEFMLEYDSQ